MTIDEAPKELRAWLRTKSTIELRQLVSTWETTDKFRDLVHEVLGERGKEGGEAPRKGVK